MWIRGGCAGVEQVGFDHLPLAFGFFGFLKEFFR